MNLNKFYLMIWPIIPPCMINEYSESTLFLEEFLGQLR